MRAQANGLQINETTSTVPNQSQRIMGTEGIFISIS